MCTWYMCMLHISLKSILPHTQEYDPSQNLSKEEETEQASVHEDKSEEDYARIRRKSKEKFVPASAHYQDKYKHIIGTETGLEAARKAEPNVKFGMGMCYCTSLAYRIAGKVGGEFTLVDWRFLCPLLKYNLSNISLKKPNILLYVTIKYL